MIDLSKSAWMQQEFTLGGRDWRLNNLPPMLAKDVLTDHIRPVFASADGLDLRDEAQLLVLFGRIPSVHLKSLGKIFAKYCIKTKNDVGQWVPLDTDLDQFTQGMDPMDLLMLDFRSIAFCFGGSVLSFAHNMMELAKADPTQLQDALTRHSMPE